jgi:hypothetical protein
MPVRYTLLVQQEAIFLAFDCSARGGRRKAAFGIAGAIRLRRALTRHLLPLDLAPAREMDGTRTLAAPQAGVEPVAPIQAQDQGVVSLVEKHPSEPAPGQSKCAGHPRRSGPWRHGQSRPVRTRGTQRCPYHQACRSATGRYQN